jgi:hypothetical protein
MPDRCHATADTPSRAVGCAEPARHRGPHRHPTSRGAWTWRAGKAPTFTPEPQQPDSPADPADDLPT